jgi:hypothetical protein
MANDKKTKVTASIGGELLEYINIEMKKRAKSQAMVLADLAYEGMKYERDRETLAVMAREMQKQ